MEWRCPHCGVALSLPEHSVTSGWSFTRCYKCGGFALVRKSELSVVKLDQVPPGEHVLLPEPPLTQLSHASQANANAVAKTTQRILAKNAAPRVPFVQSGYSPQKMTYENALGIQNSASNHPTNHLTNQAPAQLQNPTQNPTQKFATRVSAFSKFFAKLGISILLITPTALLIFDKIQPPSIVQSRRISTPEVKAEIAAKATERKPNSPPILTDQVEHSAMAPEKSASEQSVSNPEPAVSKPFSKPLSVRVSNGQADIYSGPGTEYSVIGKATDVTTYPVVDWSDRWFKVILQEQGPLQTFGWIRNDLVRVTSPNVDPFH